MTTAASSKRPFDIVWWILRQRAGLAGASLALMVFTPYLGSLPVRSIPSVVAIASGDGHASGELRWLLGDNPSVAWALIVLIIAGAIAFALALIATRVSARLTALATRDLRLRLHAALLGQRPSWLRENDKGAGNADLMRTALVGQSQVVAMFAANTIPACFGVVAAALIWAQTLLSAIRSPGNEALAVAVVGAVVVILLAVNLTSVWLAGKKSQAAQKSVMLSQAQMMGAVSEAVSGLGEVQLNTAEVEQHRRLAAVLDEMTRSQVRVAMWSGLASASSRGVILLGIPLLVVAWQGLGLAPASLAVMIPALLMLQRSISSAGSLITTTKVSRPAIELVGDLVREVETGRSVGVVDAAASSTDAEALSFRGLSFAPEGEPILADVNLEVEPGETIAIVGAGGSGKSTILRLAVRLEEPAAGTVFLGDRDITELPLSEVRRRIGILRQHPTFFTRSLRANLLLDGQPATDNEIAAALATSEATEIAKRIGLDGTLDATSVTLSGSERRRLALARLLLRKPRVLLIDELEAGLPQSLATTLWRRLRDEMGSKTTCVLVTHRPDLLEVDRVAFVSEGVIAATGTHADLENNCAPYRELLAEKWSEADDE